MTDWNGIRARQYVDRENIRSLLVSTVAVAEVGVTETGADPGDGALRDILGLTVGSLDQRLVQGPQ